MSSFIFIVKVTTAYYKELAAATIVHEVSQKIFSHYLTFILFTRVALKRLRVPFSFKSSFQPSYLGLS